MAIKSKAFSVNNSVGDLIKLEDKEQISSPNGFEIFRKNSEKVKYELIKFLINAKEKNQIVIGYGAAARRNTLLNYCGIKSDLIKFIADKAESKQNLYMPGSHIPIKHPKYLDNENLDYLLVLPWNLIKEIKNENKNKILVTAIPKLMFY